MGFWRMEDGEEEEEEEEEEGETERERETTRDKGGFVAAYVQPGQKQFLAVPRNRRCLRYF